MHDVLNIAAALFLVGCAPGRLLQPGAADAVALVADVEAGSVRAVDAVHGTDLGVVLLDEDLPADLLREELQPAGLALAGRHLLVSSFAGGEVLSLDLDQPSRIELVYSDRDGGPALEEPCDLHVAGDTLLVLGNDTRNLLLVDLDGGDLRELGGESGTPIRSPHGVTALDDGRLVIGTSPSTQDLGLLQVWDPGRAERVDDMLPLGELQQATDVIGGPAGLLVVADWFGDQVVLVDPDSQQLVEVLLGPDQVQDPVALAWAPGGQLLVLQRHSLLRWSRLEGARTLVDDLDFGRGLVVLPR